MEKNKKYEELIKAILYLHSLKALMLCGRTKEFFQGPEVLRIKGKEILTLDNINLSKFVETSLFVYGCLRDQEPYIYKNLEDDDIKTYNSIKYFSIFAQEGGDIETIREYFKKD